MSFKSVYHNFTTGTTTLPNYNQNADNLGSLLLKSSGSAEWQNYITCPLIVARPNEQSTPFTAAYVAAASKNSEEDYVLLAENSTAAVTRRLQLYVFNRVTKSFSFLGAVRLNWSLTGNKTVKDLALFVNRYTEGTVGVSGSTVTGSSTAWQSEKISAGARIGFGSKNPKDITNWYDITSITSETQLTISGSISVPSGSDYVIEEMRVLVLLTSSISNNGGLFLVKGLHERVFSVFSETNIPEATADRTRAIFALRDPDSALTTAAGLAVKPRSSPNQHIVYVLNGAGTTSARIFAFNIQQNLTNISANGFTNDAHLFSTGTATVTGNIGGIRACTGAVAGHGPASGQWAIYFVVTNRWHCIPDSLIVSGSTTFVSNGYAIVETPPGGPATFATPVTLSSISYDSSLDRFIVMSAGANATRSYFTRFNSSGDWYDAVLFGEDRVQVHNTSVATTPRLNLHAGRFDAVELNGITYMVRNLASSATNQLYAVILSADHRFCDSTNQFYISPAIPTPNCVRYERVFISADRSSGFNPWDSPCEPFKVFYRTSGIQDNTGGWTELTEPMSLRGVDGASHIQFKIAFTTIGTLGIQPRIYGIGVLYQDSSTSSYWEPSVVHSSVSQKRFAWRFKTAYGGTVPILTVKLYNAVTNDLLVTDTTSNPNGTWEKSTDNGQTWGPYNSSDKTNETTYIRYTPVSISDNVKVRALLI